MKCSCQYAEALRRYLDPRASGIDFAAITNLTNSPLIPLIRKKVNYLIRVESPDMSMSAFKAHLKAALIQEFQDSINQNREALTWSRIGPNEVTGVKFDKFKPYDDKVKDLIGPDLLIIEAAAFPTWKVFFKELELLMADRIQRGKSTWIVSTDFAKLKSSNDYDMSNQFTLLLTTLMRDNQISITRSETKALKTDKKPVINTRRGLGLSGVDPTLLSINKSVETRIAETEKEFAKSHDSDGSDG